MAVPGVVIVSVAVSGVGFVPVTVDTGSLSEAFFPFWFGSYSFSLSTLLSNNNLQYKMAILKFQKNIFFLKFQKCQAHIAALVICDTL